MENQTKDSKISATSILYQIFPPPDGVEYMFFKCESTSIHICLCDVAGKCFVGKGFSREAAQESSAKHAIEGLGLALVQNDKGNEVVNIANEKRRLEFMVRDLKSDLINAETRQDAELKLHKDTIQNLREEATILNSDLIKMRDEKEIMALENEKLKNSISTKLNLGKESHTDAQFKRKVSDIYDKCDSQVDLDLDPLEKRPKIQFTLHSKKSQDELKLLSGKLAVLEGEKKSLQEEKEKIKRKYCDKYNDLDKVYKIQMEEIKKLKLQMEEIKRIKLKNRRLIQSNIGNNLKIFNLEVKSKAYDEVESQLLIMKEESKKLQANYVKLEKQHEKCAIQGGFMKQDSEALNKSEPVIILDGDHDDARSIVHNSEHIQLKRNEVMCKLVKVLIQQVDELKENSADVIESMKKLSQPI